MNTWVRLENGKIMQVMQCEYKPLGSGEWLSYPLNCDLAGPRNIAGRDIAEFDKQGMFINRGEA